MLRAGTQLDTLVPPPVEAVPAVVSFFAPLILPIKIIQDESQLRDYVAGDEFAHVLRVAGDRVAVDFIFRRALQLSWNNTGEALLISMLATFEHRMLGIRLPVIGFQLWLPLTGEFEEDFVRRVRALPSRLYPDSPREGDRDKLQHFFGSAMLTVMLESSSEADEIGLFVEEEEESFVVGGVNDVRDLRANREGQRFGQALIHSVHALPSSYLAAQTVH